MPYCHQRLPFQNVVIRTRSPSNLFTRVSPPWFPRRSFRGFPSVTPGPLPTLPTLPSLASQVLSSTPARRLLLSHNFQVQPLITCFSHQLPRSRMAHPCHGPPLPTLSILLPRSHPLKSVPGCPRDSTSLPWASHLWGHAPLLHHLLRP